VSAALNGAVVTTPAAAKPSPPSAIECRIPSVGWFDLTLVRINRRVLGVGEDRHDCRFGRIVELNEDGIHIRTCKS
jgi:hypothetical protein